MADLIIHVSEEDSLDYRVLDSDSDMDLDTTEPLKPEKIKPKFVPKERICAPQAARYRKWETRTPAQHRLGKRRHGSPSQETTQYTTQHTSNRNTTPHKTTPHKTTHTTHTMQKGPCFQHQQWLCLHHIQCRHHQHLLSTTRRHQ